MKGITDIMKRFEMEYPAEMECLDIVICYLEFILQKLESMEKRWYEMERSNDRRKS